MPPYLHPTSTLAAEFWAQGRSGKCPVVDMHAHLGPFSGIHFPLDTAEAMVRHMDRTGVRLACFAHHDALGSPEIGNRTALEAVQAFPDRLRAYLTINPNYPDLTRQELPLFDAHPEAFLGLKLHPSMHDTPLDSPAYTEAMTLAHERRLPVLIHTWGGSPLCGPAQIRTLAARYPNAILILGHGLYGAWAEACAVANEHVNTFIELTAVVGKRGVVETLVAGAGSDRILYGTDLPWFDEHVYIGNILCADIGEDDKHNILHRNAERLLGPILGKAS
jgi:hypothetical protein